MEGLNLWKKQINRKISHIQKVARIKSSNILIWVFKSQDYSQEHGIRKCCEK